MEPKRFELKVLVSLVNWSNVLGTTDAEIDTVIEHVHGAPVPAEQYDEIRAQAIDHISEHAPRVIKAAELIVNSSPDPARYNKLIDLFGRMHALPVMEGAAA